MGRVRDALDDLAVDSSFVEDRAGRYARSLVRERHRRFLREYWLRLSVVALLGFALGGLVFFLPAWMRGFIGGIWIASVLWFLVLVVIQGSGTAAIAMGGTAEQWTAQEMRRLRRGGWKVTSHVRPWAWGGDVDHLAVGPGGAIVIECKWVSDEHALDHDDRVQHDREQASRGAGQIRNALRNRLHGAPVRSAVVYWGAVRKADGFIPGSTEDPSILIGAELRAWLNEVLQAPPLLSSDDVTSAWGTITHFLEQTDQQESERDKGANQTLTRRVFDLLVCPLAILVTFWVAALCIGMLGAIGLMPIVGLFGAGTFLYLKSPTSSRARRRIGVGVIASSAFIVVVLGALYLGSGLFHF